MVANNPRVSSGIFFPIFDPVEAVYVGFLSLRYRVAAHPIGFEFQTSANRIMLAMDILPDRKRTQGSNLASFDTKSNDWAQF